MLTRKDYRMIAESFKHQLEGWQSGNINPQISSVAVNAIRMTVVDMANQFQKDNPKFRIDRFLEAAGLWTN